MHQLDRRRHRRDCGSKLKLKQSIRLALLQAIVNEDASLLPANVDNLDVSYVATRLMKQYRRS
jgi:hypothetical protein